MTPYSNPRTNVAAYEAGEGVIRVRFRDGKVYTYTDASAGADNVAEMKRLAAKGEGLNSFITRHVRDLYESKS